MGTGLGFSENKEILACGSRQSPSTETRVTLALVHRYPKIAKVRKEKRRRQPLYLSLPLATRGPYCPRPGPAW